MTTITDEAVEAFHECSLAHGARLPNRVVRAALTAALPFMGETQEQGSSQDPGQHPCGEQPSPAVSATAALAPDIYWTWARAQFWSADKSETAVKALAWNFIGMWKEWRDLSASTDGALGRQDGRQQEPQDEPIPTTPATVGGE